MRWPWVSRRFLDHVEAELQQLRATTVAVAAYDAVCRERDGLREQNKALLDHLTRMDRREHGLAEVPRPPRQPIEPMPQELTDYYDGFANQGMAKLGREEARRRHAQGEKWPVIMESIIPPEMRVTSGKP